MDLIHIDPRFLDKVWPMAAPILERAIAKNHGEHTLDQLRAEIAYGGSQLLVQMDGDNLVAAATVQFKQYPGYRTAWIGYLAGETSHDVFPLLKEWAVSHGASKLECLCGPAQARLFSEYGFSDTYRVVRCDL